MLAAAFALTVAHVTSCYFLQDLTLAEEQPDQPVSNLRNMTDDMKRALGALGTSEANDAFSRGGGGKRAEAARLLAEAKLRTASGAGASTSGRGAADGSAAGAAGVAGKASDGQAAGADGDVGDWRLRAPESNRDMPKFKPGAVTWDTEDYSTEESKKQKHKQQQKQQQSAKAGQAGVPGASDAGGRPTPQQWYEARHVKFVESHLTTGTMSRGFTSTVAVGSTKNVRQQVRLERHPTKKGYLRLHTNLGDLNIELHSDIVPRTCENFLALCEMGYYDGIKFHRSIKNFMIQVGISSWYGTNNELVGSTC